MADFGGVVCSLVKAEVQAMRENAVAYQVVAVDGQGYHRIGKRGQPQQVRCILYTNRAGVTAFVAAIEALMSTQLTYTNDYNITSGTCYMIAMAEPQIRPAIGEGDLRCEIVATVQPLA